MAAAGKVIVGAVKAGARRRRPLASPLTITDRAADRLKRLLSNNNEAEGVLLGVRTRGCNGLSYTLNYVTAGEPAPKGGEVVEEKGVTVHIHPKALFHVVGTEMDYKVDDVASEFVFKNPNATGSCGCGESFSVG